MVHLWSIFDVYLQFRLRNPKYVSDKLISQVLNKSRKVRIILEDLST